MNNRLRFIASAALFLMSASAQAATQGDRMLIAQPIDPVDLFGKEARALNVYGQPLQPCSMALRAGSDRSGYCRVSPQDAGVHGVCARVTAEFLAYTLKQGNDLVTPQPWARFPGLQPGDFWCVCAGRWQQALDAGVAPPINPNATSIGVLSSLFADDLNKHLWLDTNSK